MSGKSTSPRSSRRKESQIKTGKSQRLVTSSPTAELHDDAPPYQVGARSTASQTSEEKSGTLWKASLPLKFLDLFCGIGGFRRAFEQAGARCVFSSDWDKFSRQTYAANFNEPPHGDIHAVAVTTCGKSWRDVPKEMTTQAMPRRWADTTVGRHKRRSFRKPRAAKVPPSILEKGEASAYRRKQ